jgi:hypothetical protein
VAGEGTGLRAADEAFAMAGVKAMTVVKLGGRQETFRAKLAG